MLIYLGLSTIELMRFTAEQTSTECAAIYFVLREGKNKSSQ